MEDNNKIVLEHYIYAFSKLNDIQLNDMGVYISDTEKLLFCRPARRLNIIVKPGELPKSGSVLYRVLHEKRQIIQSMDALLHGVPYIGIGTPIFNEIGETVGGIAILEPIDRYETLKESSSQLKYQMETISRTCQEIAVQSEEIAVASQNLTETLKLSQKRVRETDEVLNLIKNVARQTNLLGLNAAIEAGRVGHQGRGFGIVAHEIRRLSKTIDDSIKDIEESVILIQKDSADNLEQITRIVEMITNISKETNQVAQTTQFVNNMSLKLNELADALVTDKNK